MFAGFAGLVTPGHLAPGSDQQRSAELPGVALDPRLAVALFLGLPAPAQGAQVRHPTEPALQARCTKGSPGGVGVDRKLDPELLDEGLDVVGRTVADGVQLGTQGADGLGVRDQASDPLATEDSAEVTQVDEDRGAVSPEAVQGHHLTLGIEQGQILEGISHGHSSPGFVVSRGRGEV